MYTAFVLAFSRAGLAKMLTANVNLLYNVTFSFPDVPRAR